MNNSKLVELEAITVPGWLMYDSDPSYPPMWLYPGGRAQEFVPPCYPWKIDSVSLALKTPVPSIAAILFMDDDGTNGAPGTILHEETTYVEAPGFPDWQTIDIPWSVNTIYSGAFYVGFIPVDDSIPLAVFENVGPFSRRGWELLNSTWFPYMDRDNSELLIRVYSPAGGINEGKSEKKLNAPTRLQAYPNPLRKNTKICFSLPNDSDINLTVYNLSGQEVKTLVSGHQKAGTHSIIFNTKDSKGNPLPQGIYFCRLSAGEQSLTQKLTLLR